MNSFQVSVIIPVYRSEPYVEKAVLSALAQGQVKEVILIEDASPDNSFDICQKLEKKYSKVKLFTHPGHKNMGPGASRNLGIINASYRYISFLDSDDYFLPTRFTITEKLFCEHIKLDAVFEACGFEFYTQEARQLEIQLFGLKDSEIENHLYTITEKMSPKDFFYKFLVSQGFFHADGVTFKKKILKTTGYMDEELELHQDTEFFHRIMALSVCMSGEVHKPVSIIGRHERNRITHITKDKIKYQIMVWKKLFLFCKKHIHEIDKRAARHIARNRVIFYDESFALPNKYLRLILRFKNLIKLLIKNPSLVKFI